MKIDAATRALIQGVIAIHRKKQALRGLFFIAFFALADSILLVDKVLTPAFQSSEQISGLESGTRS